VENHIIIVVNYFWVPTKKKERKYTYIYIYISKKIFRRNPKIVRVRKRRWNAHKMARNGLRRFKMQEVKF
jgi:hypothetical protein